MDNEQKIIAEAYMKELQSKMIETGKEVYPEDWSIIEDNNNQIWIKKERFDGMQAPLYPVPKSNN